MRISDWSSDVCSSDLVGAKRLDDRRPDQPLDIGARRVVGTQLGPLLGVERALQKRAEDGGLDLRPAMLGRLNQHLQLLRVERDRSTIFKQIPVELPERHPERGREVARIHRRPQGGERSEEHTSELQSLMRISYAVFCLKKKKHTKSTQHDMTKTNT